MSEKKKQVVVVGNGMVGFRFCEKLLESDAFHEYQITVLSEELTPAYDRVNLSKLFAGALESELIFAESRWYDYYKINLKLGAKAVRIDRDAKTVTTAGGNEFSYDHLVFATGSRPHIPSINGTDLDGVHVYRTTDDVYDIRETARKASSAVVIGGGLLGLEAAEACREMGLETTIVEREPFLMACQLDEAAGRHLLAKVDRLGIHSRTGAHIASLKGDGPVEAVELEGGESISAQLVILATGIQPNHELGQETGLNLGAYGGIAVNDRMETSDPSIYAIGECASFNNELYGLVAPGYAMADVAAAQLGGINKTYEPHKTASRLKLLDLHFSSLGNIKAEGRLLIDQDPRKGVYKKLIFDPKSHKLLGAILVGEDSEFERLRNYLDSDTVLPVNPKDILAPIGKPLTAEVDMDDDDVVCFCNYVTKGDICRAIDRNNLKSTGEVMGTTYAAGLCGSCLSLVDAVTKQHLANKIDDDNPARL
jgi:nitrite reductase (NADH) large subunit